jgi:hypothetical protein
MKRSVAEMIASTVNALNRCTEAGKRAWQQKHEARLVTLERNHLPSGAGIDNGCVIDRERTTLDKIVIQTAYHHMNDVGMYDGWTEHNVTVRPTFIGFDIKVSGRNRNDVKDYLAECFEHALSQEVEE